ncbi:DNA-binding transcriptional regulator, MarR family [Marivirga sericea]|uniref:DNA-binding transcriptional regulator, MarR family n=1 Tax=Marivirga sericea TaxID=1028 RepID=A0A1X7L1J0_9BACT|nr:MarR family transcriptional regulator [Marivirga sericea]SMG46989.1 DNA-binding transcriptional regulator, MarR family [Marivirga sericea]
MIDYKNNIGRLVGHLNHRFLRKLDEEFKKKDIALTAEQFRLMTVLWDKDGVSQQSLATLIGRNRASTGKMIDILEKKGILERHDHPTDRRLKLIFVSKQGKKLDEKARIIAKEVIQMAINGIPEVEVKLVTNHLFLMLKNLR